MLEKNELTVTLLNRDAREYAATVRVTGREEMQEAETRECFGAQEEAYRIMLRNFADAIRDGEPLIAPGSDGKPTLEIINGAYLSAWRGERVKIPVDSELYEQMLNQQND